MRGCLRVGDLGQNLQQGGEADLLILTAQLDLHDGLIVPEGVDIDLEVLVVVCQARAMVVLSITALAYLVG